MNHLKHIGLIMLGTAILFSCEICNNSHKAEANSYLGKLSERSLKLPKTAIVNVAKLHPFEILFRNAISYADITLSLANNQNRPTEITIDTIEIVDLETDQVLFSNNCLAAVRQFIQISSKSPKPQKQSWQQLESLTLAPKEKITLDYRLKSPNKLYQKGKKVYTKVYYRQDQQLTRKVISSEPANIAFKNP